MKKIHNICTRLEGISPSVPVVLLSATFRELCQSALEDTDAVAVDQGLGQAIIHYDVHIQGRIIKRSMASHVIEIRLQ